MQFDSANNRSATQINMPYKGSDKDEGEVELFDSSESLELEVGKAVRPLSTVLPLLYFILSIVMIFGLQSYYFNKTNTILIEKDIEGLEHSNDLVSILIKNFYADTKQTILDLSKVELPATIANSMRSGLDIEIEKLLASRINKSDFYKSISVIDTSDNSVVTFSKSSNNLFDIKFNEETSALNQDLHQDIINMSEGEVYFSPIKVVKKSTNTVPESNLEVSVYTKIPKAIFFYSPFWRETSASSLLIEYRIDIGYFFKKAIVSNLSEIEFYVVNEIGEYIFKPDNTITVSSLVIDDFPSLESIISDNVSSYSLQPNQNELIPYPGFYGLLNLSASGAVEPYRMLLLYYDPDHVSDLIDVRNKLIIFGVILSILCWLLIWGLTHIFFRPLRTMSQAISMYEETGTVNQLPLSAKDEVGVLSRSFYNLLKNKEQKELDLSKTRKYLEGITNESPVILAYVDIYETHHFINTTFQKWLNKTEVELLGLTIEDIIKEQYPLVEPYVKQALNGVSIQFSDEFNFSDGVIRNLKVTFSPRIDEYNQVVGFYICGEDITDITRATKQIQELSQRLEIALVSPGIGVWEYDVKTSEHIWDQRMYGIFHLEADSAIKNYAIGFKEFAHPDDQAHIDDILSLKETENDVYLVFRIILPDQTIRWVESHFRILRNDLGTPTRLIGTSTDITSRKTLELEKDLALLKAEESTKLKSEFLASMSHEIRTPMNGVLGMLGLVEHTHLTQRQSHYINLAKSSADSLLLLINDILDFSKVEAGKMAIESDDFHLPDLLGDVTESIAHRAQEKNVELILDFTGIIETHVKGDASRLRQILFNLVGNAIKFTEEGEIKIIAKLDKQDDHSFVFHCRVEDTGFGIPASKVHLLFDSFSQVDASTTRKYGGTGLGLAIVKQLCQLMGGDVTLSSVEGEGSQFSFSIHLDKSPLSQSLVTCKSIANRSILVIDNNKSSLTVIANQFRLWDANVVECQSSTEALAYFSNIKEQCDLVLIDQNSDDSMNHVVSERLRQDRRYNSLPLVLMTSLEEKKYSKNYGELSFSAYFPKPMTLNDYVYVIKLMLNPRERLPVDKIGLDITNLAKINQVEGEQSSVNKVTKSVSIHSGSKENLVDRNIRLLLVEDNFINQEVAVGILNNLPIDVCIANNGVEALELLNSNENDRDFDLILMDCHMPEMDGYETTKAIRNAHTSNTMIPIIAMTANAMAGDKEKCLTAGMDAYISKPIDPNELISSIYQWLPTTFLPYDKEPETANRVKYMSNDKVASTPKELPLTWDREDFMNRIMNNKKIADKLLILFERDTPITIKQLGEAIKSGKVEEAGKIAHKLKGSVSNLGGIDLAGIAKRIELAGYNKNLNELELLWPSVQPKYDQLVKEISRGLT